MKGFVAGATGALGRLREGWEWCIRVRARACEMSTDLPGGTSLRETACSGP
jgi:hypothetical protein